MSVTVYKDASRYIEVDASDDLLENCQYRIKIPIVPNGIFTFEELTDGLVVNEINFFVEDVGCLVDALLDAKREYRNMFD